MSFVAVKAIDHPLGSGVWAYQEGDEVPEANVKLHGYDKVSKEDGGPLVARADAKVDDKGAK